jgi:GNAT superfamily N-acetyltransferase
MIDDGTFFVIEDGGELIACGGWNRRDRSTGRLLDPRTEPALIRFMFVRPDRTRRGLGTRILAACEDAARAEGFGLLALTASLPGLPLYEHDGFIVTEDTTVALPGGVTLDTAEMEKPIYR